jgi:hypothetical protein
MIEPTATGASSISDVEIRKRIWEGTIPICFQLATNEITTLEKPHPFYVSIILFSLNLFYFVFMVKILNSLDRFIHKN